MIVPFAYMVDRDQRYGRYMAFIHPKRFKHLKLPYKIKDEFSSISVTYPWPQACAHKGNVNSIHFETYFFDKFSSLFKAYWDYQYGIPTVYFTGKLDVFAEEVRHIPIFLLTLQNTYIDKLYQLMYWEDAIMKFDKPCLFIHRQEENTFMSNNKAIIKQYLRLLMINEINMDHIKH